MQPIKPDGAAATLDERLRVMRIVWAALLLAVGFYALVAYFVDPPTDVERRANGEAATAWLLPLLVILGAALVLVSIVVKRAYARRAEAERRPELLQTGLIVGAALCDAAALFGFVGLFVTGDRYAYVLFVVGAVGILLHFPARDRLLAAAPRGLG